MTKFLILILTIGISLTGLSQTQPLTFTTIKALANKEYQDSIVLAKRITAGETKTTDLISRSTALEKTTADLNSRLAALESMSVNPDSVTGPIYKYIVTADSILWKNFLDKYAATYRADELIRTDIKSLKAADSVLQSLITTISANANSIPADELAKIKQAIIDHQAWIDRIKQITFQ